MARSHHERWPSRCRFAPLTKQSADIAATTAPEPDPGIHAIYEAGAVNAATMPAIMAGQPPPRGVGGLHHSIAFDAAPVLASRCWVANRILSDETLLSRLGQYLDGRTNANARPNHLDGAVADGDAAVGPISEEGDRIKMPVATGHAVDLDITSRQHACRVRPPHVLCIGIGDVKRAVEAAMRIHAINAIGPFRGARIALLELGSNRPSAQSDRKGREDASGLQQQQPSLGLQNDDAIGSLAAGSGLGLERPHGEPRGSKHETATYSAAGRPPRLDQSMLHGDNSDHPNHLRSARRPQPATTTGTPALVLGIIIGGKCWICDTERQAGPLEADRFDNAPVDAIDLSSRRLDHAIN